MTTDQDKHDFVPGTLDPHACDVCGDNEGANDHLDADDDGHTWGGMDGFTQSDIDRLDALSDEYGAERVIRWVADGWDYAGSDNPTPPSE